MRITGKIKYRLGFSVFNLVEKHDLIPHIKEMPFKEIIDIALKISTIIFKLNHSICSLFVIFFKVIFKFINFMIKNIDNI